MPCPTFEDAFAAVQEGKAELAMIPDREFDRRRVADIHLLLPTSGLHIIGEHFLPIHFQLMALPGASLATIKDVYSHVHAIGQCRKIVRKLGLKAHVAGDTAGSARQVAEWGDPTKASLAPRMAASIYGLQHPGGGCGGRGEQHDALRHPFAQGPAAAQGSGPLVTSFVFRVRNVAAALYKAPRRLRGRTAST